jgi:hypothetical protein
MLKPLKIPERSAGWPHQRVKCRSEVPRPGSFAISL